MSDKLDLSGMTRIFAIEIYHRNPNATPVWFRVVNAESEKEAIRTAILLFIGNGLSELLIDEINSTELVPLKGGENA